MRYRFDDFVLDVEAYRLERLGTPLALEPKAFDLLLLFVQRPGQLLTKQAIFEAVWPDTAVTDHALTRVIAQLRRTLGDEAREATYIETIPTRGYRWVRSVEHLSTAPAAVATPSTGPSPSTAIVPEPSGAAPPAVVPIAVALLAALVVALAIWARGGASRAADLPASANVDVPWPQQLTTNPGLDLQPALSPLGDGFAYASDRSGALEIYVRSFDGTAVETALTSDGQQNIQPAWSPDGRLIAYHSASRGGIWVIPARGGVPRQVVPLGSRPAWSPDGQLIAYQSDEHADVSPSGFGAQAGSTIWVVGTDGASPREVTRAGVPDGGHSGPAWSHDGRHIAFTVFEGGADNGVWVHRINRGDTVPIARGPGVADVVFSPDDSAVYAAGGEALILRIPFDAENPTTDAAEMIVVPGVPGVRGLSLSADGRRLAFAGPALKSHIWAQPVDPSGAPRGEPRSLTDDTSRRNSLPVVSPDGRRVAYMSTRSGTTPHVWVMDIDGRNRVQVSSDHSANFKPNWFPDGRRVVFLSNRDGRFGIWAADVDTRREQLWFDASTESSRLMTGRLAEFDLSPSSTRAAFAMLTAPARRVIYVATLNPFAPRRLTEAPHSVGYPAWSPDERFLAVEIREGASTHAGVLDVDSGALRVLTRERGETWVRSWSPDGRRVAYAALREGVWSLQSIDIATGERRNMTPQLPPNQYVRYPEWSPKGDLVVFERGELNGNIWQLLLQR